MKSAGISVAYLLFILIFFFPVVSLAEPAELSSVEEDEQEEGILDEECFEESRSDISARLFNLTDDVDALVNDARSVEQRMDDWIRLGAEVRFRSADSLRIRQKIGAGFNLDMITERLRLIFEAENGDAYHGSERVEDTPRDEDFI